MSELVFRQVPLPGWEGVVAGAVITNGVTVSTRFVPYQKYYDRERDTWMFTMRTTPKDHYQTPKPRTNSWQILPEKHTDIRMRRLHGTSAGHVR